jgi:hypothetical protein
MVLDSALKSCDGESQVTLMQINYVGYRMLSNEVLAIADPHANRLLGLLSPRDYERLRVRTSPSDLSMSSRLGPAPW